MSISAMKQALDVLSAHPEQDGMALRDYFAAKAMQAVLTRESFFHNEPFEKGVSQWCYSMADEMLKARE